ncbi:MAG: glycosyltransferase family 4 protein [Bacteroidales bacterium]|nr:glycosyltransferase family 4 protein [Bacteroidales bacterium]
MQSITFLFPRTGEIPIGGFKVVYEYANRLVKDGYSVNIIYGIVSRPCITNHTMKYAYYLLRFFRWLKYLYIKDYKPSSWFITDEKINHLLRYTLGEKQIPQTDYYVATSWSTAVWLNDYKQVKNKNKFYLIQHFEDWHGPHDIVLKTWKMELTKIVIAPWLQKIAEDLGEKCFLIENGFDQRYFHITIPIEEKDKYSAIMLWHDNPFKDCPTGLKALLIVKEKYPQFKVSLFGVSKKPKLPEWIEYHQMPSFDEHLNLYNYSSIFVGPSSKEGFCLTPPEAMLCGCAVACTNIGGYTVVAKDNETALLSEVGNADALSKNIIRLIEDDFLRIRIAKSGNELIKQFTWERAYNKFLNVINTPK